MTTSQARSLLTIGEVARRTGVSPATLRAWERRYGVPLPSRAPSGYRLYGRDALNDIAALRRQQSSGARPQQAALYVTGRRTPRGVVAASRIRAWQRRLRAACLRFDNAAADEVIADVSRAVGDLNAVKRVVFPVVASVGDAWHGGHINISQEHFASHLAQRVAMALAPATPEGSRSPILTGCAPGERHELGLLLLVAELRSCGYRVVHLGCDVPVGAFLAALDSLQAGVAVVGATMPAHLAPWSARRREVERRRRGGVQFVWGGPGASPAAGALPGFVTDSCAHALEAIAEWFGPQRGGSAAEIMTAVPAK